MSIKLTRIRARVQVKLNVTDARNTVLDLVKIDQEVCEAYIALQSFLPAPVLYTASAFTIAAGLDTFTLPVAAATGWTGNDGGAEYNGEVRIRLQQPGYFQFLKKITNEEMDAYKHGIPSTPIFVGIPQLFSLYEAKEQTVNGRIYPGAKDAHICDLWASFAADDLRDYVGAGTENLDNVEAQLSRIATAALVSVTAGNLLAAMHSKKAEELGLDKSVAAGWLAEGWNLAYGDAARRYNVEDTSDSQRRVG